MRPSAEKTNKILKLFAIFGGTSALIICVALGLYWNFSQSTDKGEEASRASASYDSIHTEAVLNEENADGSRDFLNRKLPEYPDDKRAVFKIIEVIPHEACSIFPYLVDWKTEEEYNKNVPVGYEGLFWCVAHTGDVQMFSPANTLARDSAPYTSKKGYLKREYLSVYKDSLGDENSGKWYRQTDESSWLTETGYFEYVGQGNGLYYIPTSFKADTEWEKGIHYEMQAIKRTSTQPPQGEMYVKSPAYYWAKDNLGDAKPKYYDEVTLNNKDVLSTTEFNYDLSFKQDVSGNYRVNIDKLKEKTVTPLGVSSGLAAVKTYDYFLEPEDAAAWLPGFALYKNGNYRVTAATESATGAYIRVDDNRNSDGYTDAALNIGTGYFLKHNNDSAYAGYQKYDVTFTGKAAGEKGYYVANAPAWNTDTGWHFTYTGDNAGRYDVSFIYDATVSILSSTRYKANLLKVENKQGRYALTSTEKASDGNPVYVNKDASGLPCDYSNVVTNITFLQNTLDWGKSDNAGFPGITLGGNSWTEWGGWVFHPITDASEMDVTKLSKVYKERIGQNTNTDAYFTVGDRIYVTNQKRTYRYYTRNSYINNEWFKLLCYSDNPQDTTKPYSEVVNGVGYYMDQTPEWNLKQEASKKLIAAFDNQYRIEIIQKTPDKLTPEDVDDADLLYFSPMEGVEGLARNWNAISQHLKDRGLDALPPLDNYVEGGRFKYTSDLSPDTLFAIYRACIYERTTALMVNRKIRTDYSQPPAIEQLMKMYYFMDYFKEAREWSYFIEDYPDYRDTYSTIHQSDSCVRAYKEGVPYYNMVRPDEGTAAYENFVYAWDPAYFEVKDPITGQVLLSGDSSFQADSKTSTGKVYDGETKFLFEEYIVRLFKNPDQMHNIWKILNNRTGVGDIVVEITNAETLADTARTKVIYGNEFDPQSFDVKYEIFRLGGKGAPTPLSDATISFLDASGNVISPPVNVNALPLYNEEYMINVRSGFIIPTMGLTDLTAPLDPTISSRTVKVVATDSAGKTGEATVIIMVREGFNLN